MNPRRVVLNLLLLGILLLAGGTLYWMNGQLEHLKELKAPKQPAAPSSPATTSAPVSPTKPSPAAATPNTATLSTNNVPQPSTTNGPAARSGITPAASATEALPPQDQRTPEDDLRILSQMLGYYRRSYGQNPDGGFNARIMRQLSGHNAQHLNFIPSGWYGTNSLGEMVDRWGNPYYFHPLSADRMELRSPGPDGLLYTPDDLLSTP